MTTSIIANMLRGLIQVEIKYFLIQQHDHLILWCRRMNDSCQVEMSGSLFGAIAYHSITQPDT